MTTLLLDTSVLLAAFDPEDDHHEPARALPEDDNITLATLDLARYEVTNVAVWARRTPETVPSLLAVIEKACRRRRRPSVHRHPLGTCCRDRRAPHDLRL